MKKLTTLFLTCLLIFGYARAQYVNIPDANFRAFLMSTYPAAFNVGGQMDTTNSKIVQTDSLTTYYNILGGSRVDTIHFQGLQYFKNLKFLYIEPMLLVSTAVIDNNVLPNSIKTLQFGGLNSVVFNTSKLPDSLINFTVIGCGQFIGTNVTFPPVFKNFTFSGTRSYNPWINGNSFPNTMETFKVDALMNYSPLANLPGGLKTFELNTCWGVTDFSYMTLPSGLQNLSFIDANRNVDTNTIVLPNLPSTLMSLNLNGTKTLCLPLLPDSLQTLDITGASVPCISKLPNAYLQVTPNTPVCNIANNANGCTVYGVTNYVNIPDSNFAKYLISQAPSCLYKDSSNLYWMDTTCNNVLYMGGTLNCNNMNIKSVEGLEFLKYVRYISCDSNQLVSLPDLSRLQNLLSLSCKNNKLVTLPLIESSYYFGIDCSNNMITSLPKLSYMLTSVICNNNLMTSLPVFDYNIGYAEFKNNLITSLIVPGYNVLRYLYCDSNKITNVSFDASYLDSSSIVVLSLSGNSNLTCLPHLPYIQKLDVNGTNIACLPNIPPSFYNYPFICIPANIPVCSNSYDPNNCTIYYNYVNIPDSNFAKYLINKIPSCLFKDSSNYYWMDTTCSGVLNTTNIDVSKKQISNLTGIHYFKSLKTLYCDSNFLYNLISLPDSITFLSCSYNYIRGLYYLPNSINTLNCDNNLFNNLFNLPTNLFNLSCRNNKLASLPQLPNSLGFLNCSYNQLSGIPAMPSNLHTLDCSNNKLTSLNITGTPHLTYLNADSNRITNFINLTMYDTVYTKLSLRGNANLSCLPQLPSQLGYLDVRGTNIQCIPNSIGGHFGSPSLPPVCNTNYNPNNCTVYNNYVNIPDSNFAKYLIGQIPSCLYKDSNNLYWMDTTCSGILNIQSIICNNLNIKSIEGVQYFKVLHWLDCSNNLIDSLPNIGSYLYEFKVSNNKLNSLPSSLKFNLSSAWVDCSNNYITSIPSWFSNYRFNTFNCSNNQISSVPNFAPDDTSSVIIDTLGFYVNGNLHLSCLPHLPNYLLSIDVTGTNVACIPNPLLPLRGYGWIPQITPSNLTICNPTSNANQCQVFPIVHGKVFTDNNSNGLKDGNEYYRPFVQLNASNGTSVVTNTNGEYTLALTDTGTYILTTVVPAGFKAVPASNTFSFNNNVASLILPDIALQPINTNDSLTVFIMPLLWAKPGQEIQYFVSYENVGSVLANDTVKIVYDTAHLIFDSCSMPVISQIGNTIITSNNVLTPGDYNYYFAYFTVKPTAVLGDSIFATASIASVNTVASYATYQNVVSSYDPNYKDATPELSPVQVVNGTFIDYNIHFQNTGNDTAFNIVLADTLSPLLKSNILQVVATSHPCNITLKDSIIYFEFLKINLPDSNRNNFRSNGFVHFRLLPQSNVPAGGRINNKASIYFDYNKPVVTNTASTLIKPYGVPVVIRNYNVVAERVGENQLLEVINTWTVSTEINTAYYTIQRSITGRDFENVGKVIAKDAREYSYTDIPTTDAKVIYYRLKITDKDGKLAYSDIKQIFIQPQTMFVSIYPNPAKNYFTVKGYNVSQINVVDNTGRIVMSRKGLNSNALENKVNINVADGIYIIQVTHTDGTITNEKLMIKN